MSTRSIADEHSPHNPLTQRVYFRIGFLLTVAGALACLWIAWCEFPFHAWNDMRLAPAFAVRLGVNPYPLLDAGPLFTWIYGPVGILINLPATFAATPLGALRIAGCINAFVVLAPIAILFFSSLELRLRGWALPWFGFCVATLLVPRPNLVLQVADHGAIAFGLLANWMLARKLVASPLLLILAAGATVLAAWSKQIAICLPVAHLLFFVLHGQRRSLVVYVGALAVFHVVALLIFVAAFGFENLWLNMVAIPGQLGWASIMSRLALRPIMLTVQVLLPALALGAVWRGGWFPGTQSESGRSFHLGALSFWVMLPIGLAGYFKAGGDINLVHSWDYIMPVAVICVLSAIGRHAGRTSFSYGLCAALALAARAPDLIHPPREPFTGHFDMAANLAAAHPGQIWFPQNPVIGWYADRVLWHTEDGVSTRFLAGYPIREIPFKRYLPGDLQALVYPRANDAPFVAPLFQEFDHSFRYPYWIVRARAGWETSPPPSTAPAPERPTVR